MRSSSGRKVAVSAGRADLDEPGHVVGHLDPGEVGDAAVGVAHHDREVQRQPADVGEGVGRVDRQRGEHREHLVAEVLPLPPGVVVGEVLPVDDPDAGLLQTRRDVLEEHVGVPLDQVLGALGDELELLADGETVG